MHELAPGGKLRVGIGVGTVPSAFWTTRDPASGKPRGVTVEIGSDLAKTLGVPLQLVAYNNSGDVTAAGPRGEWDVAFMPVDAERKTTVDFGPAYYLSESTYAVPAGSPVQSIAELDRAGMRIIGIAGTATARAAASSLKNTTIRTYRTVDELHAVMRAGNADAVALSRTSLNGFAADFPGARVLPEHFLANSVAIAVPKKHTAALAYVSAYIEQAKASGVVRRAFDSAGLTTEAVAPADPQSAQENQAKFAARGEDPLCPLLFYFTNPWLNCRQ